jgi:hypothetical protein
MTVRRKRDGALYRIGSRASDGARLLAALSPDVWPSMWVSAAGLEADYDIVPDAEA